MSAGTTLRYDGLPLEDFLTCLVQQQREPQVESLPAAAHLKEARLEAVWRYDVNGPEVPLALYLLQERDALTENTEAFLLVRAPGSASSPLRDLALKLRDFLAHRHLPCYFRIDPTYGLVYGSALEPLDETVKWDRPGAYVTLCLTDDLSAPSLALLEYVAQTRKKRYQEIFQKYNRVQPVSPGFLKATWKKLSGGEKAEHAPRKLTYAMLSVLATYLSLGLFKDARISLIYKGLSEEHAQRMLLDPGFSQFFFTGHDRFFVSLGELS